MTHTLRDAPRVIVFPPVIPIGTVALACFLQWLHPIGFIDRFGLLSRAFAGAMLLAFGIGMMARGRFELFRSGTNVHPSRPALTLVESGVYGRTRNPMYVGGVLVMLGCAFVFALDWLPLLVVLSLVILHFGIVVPEEVYLERKFGHRYGRYKSRVPRYFRPFRRKADGN